MKLVKIFGLLVLSVIIILLIALPTEINVNKEIVIKQDISIVFEHINNLKNWEQWSPWQKLDPKVVNSYSGAESGVGAVNSYSSENSDVGIGKMKILQSIENSKVELGIFMEGMSDENNPTLTTTLSLVKMGDNHTKVTWNTIDSVGTFSFYRIMLPIMNMTLDEMFKSGLEDLKLICENFKEKIVDVELGEEISKKYKLISIRDTTIIDQDIITKNMTAAFVKMVEYLKSNKIKSESLPFTFKHKFDPESNQAIYEYGLPIDTNINAASISSDFNVIEIGGKFTVSATHTGPIRTINQAHNGITKYMELRKYESDGSPYQLYLTSPDKVGEWDMQSQVVYPVKPIKQ